MNEKPIYVKSGEIEVEIHPTHPRYHELRMELIRESHPEVSDEDQLDLGCEQLAPRTLAPDEGAEDL